MIGKFFISFVLILAYLVLPTSLFVLLEPLLGTSFVLGSIIAIVIGFIPFMIFVSKKVFTFKAENTPPISTDEMKDKIRQIEIEGCTFTVEFKGDIMVLTPPVLDARFISLYSAQRYKMTYYMKLWFNEKTNTVRFKDHLVSSSSILGINNFSFNISGQSGFVTARVTLLDSTGELTHFNNSKLHNELINVVTQNGWNLGLKLF